MTNIYLLILFTGLCATLCLCTSCIHYHHIVHFLTLSTILFLSLFLLSFSLFHRASLRNARSPSLSEVAHYLKESAPQDEVIQRYLTRLRQKLG